MEFLDNLTCMLSVLHLRVFFSDPREQSEVTLSLGSGVALAAVFIYQ